MRKDDFQAQRDVLRDIGEGGPGSTRWGNATRTPDQISRRTADKAVPAVGAKSRKLGVTPQAQRILNKLQARGAEAADRPYWDAHDAIYAVRARRARVEWANAKLTLAAKKGGKS